MHSRALRYDLCGFKSGEIHNLSLALDWLFTGTIQMNLMNKPPSLKPFNNNAEDGLKVDASDPVRCDSPPPLRRIKWAWCMQTLMSWVFSLKLRWRDLYRSKHVQTNKARGQNFTLICGRIYDSTSKDHHLTLHCFLLLNVSLEKTNTNPPIWAICFGQHTL